MNCFGMHTFAQVAGVGRQAVQAVPGRGRNRAETEVGMTEDRSI